MKKIIFQSLTLIVVIGLILIIVPFSVLYYMYNGNMGIFSGTPGFLLLAIALISLGYWALKKGDQNVISKNNTERKRFEHGSAGWATKEELENVGVERKNFSRIDDGTTWFNKDFCLSSHYHALTIAPSRTGKGASVILPNLLTKPTSSIVVIDPKGELAHISARYQKSTGQKVYILDPWNLQAANKATHGIKLSGMNPFDFIKSDRGHIIDNCSQIADLLVPYNAQAKDPYWDNAARSLIRLCMMHIVTYMPDDQHNFWTLYKMLRPIGDDWPTMLVEMQENESLDGLIARMSGEFEANPKENPLSSVVSVAQKATTIFESPEIRKFLLHSNLNPFDLSNGNCTVYVVIPYAYLHSHATWLRMIIGICIKAATTRVNKKVKFILDEFGVLGKMEEISKGFQFLAGKNITLWPFVQDLGTLKETYGDDGMNKFVANADVLQFFNAKDPFTCGFICNMLGKATKLQGSVSFNSNKDGINENRNYSSYGRELMTVEEISKDNRTIIFHAGLKTILPKDFYYKIPAFNTRADQPPH